MTDAQKGTVALVQGERMFPSFQAMLDVTVAAAPHRDRESLRRGVFHNSKRLDDGTWTWRYDSMRKGDGFDGLWDDVPALDRADHAGARSEFGLRQRRRRRAVRQRRARLPRRHRRRGFRAFRAERPAPPLIDILRDTLRG